MIKYLIIIFLFSLIPLFLNSQVAVLNMIEEAATGITDPRDIDSLMLWLDGADTDGDFTLDEETGAAPSTWDDKSANDYDFTSSGNPQISDAALNSHDVVDFDGTGDYYTSDEAAGTWTKLHRDDITIFFVYTSDNWTGLNQRVFGTIDAGSQVGFLHFLSTSGNSDIFYMNSPSSSTLCFYIGWQLDAVASNSTYYYTTFQSDVDNGTETERAKLWWDGSLETSDYQNGTTDAASGTSPTYTLRIGAAADNGDTEFNGKIAELIVYSEKLTSQQISDVEDYLTTKWGL